MTATLPAFAPGDRVIVREPNDPNTGKRGTVVRVASKEAGTWASGFSVLVDDGETFEMSRWYRPADLEKEQTG